MGTYQAWAMTAQGRLDEAREALAAAEMAIKGGSPGCRRLQALPSLPHRLLKEAAAGALLGKLDGVPTT